MCLSLVAAAWAWDPDAGRIPSFTEDSRASASSTAEDTAQIIDGDQQTHWLLEGVVAGAEAGDPAVAVLPAAFRARDPGTETETSCEYIGARITEAAGAGPDALNIHAGSYLVSSAGERIAVWPEHPASGMRNILAMIPWREAKLPGRALWLAEWAWDSEGGGAGGEEGEASEAKAPPAGCACAAPANTPGLWAPALIGLRRRR